MAAVVAFPWARVQSHSALLANNAATSPFRYVTDDDGSVAIYRHGESGRHLAPLLIMPVGKDFELILCDPVQSRALRWFGTFAEALRSAQAHLLRSANPRRHIALVQVSECA